MSTRRFPVHSDALRSFQRAGIPCPANVPWSLLEPHAAQAERNHGQTLERLAERGGLSPAEMLAVLEDRRFEGRSKEAAAIELRAHLQRWHDAMQEAERCLNCEAGWADCECTGGPLVDWRQD